MKIGLVLSKPPSYSETFFISKIKGLQDSGHQVTLFVQDNPKGFNLCKVVLAPKTYKGKLRMLFSGCWETLKLVAYPNRIRTFMRLEKQALKSFPQRLKNLYNNAHVLKANLDWLHFGFATLTIQSESVAETIGAKMATSLRGFDIAIYPVRHPGCYDLLWRKIDKVHAISNDLLMLARNNGLNTNTEFQIITPAINSDLFSKTNSQKTKPRDVIRFLTVARLHWKKGITDMLDALAILKKNGLLFTYTVVGTGDDYENLMFAVHQLGLNDEVEFVGQKSHDAIVTYLSESDVYLQYSISEGFCNAVLEAQAMGLLCVVSDAEGLQENVIHQETGVVVPKRQPQLLAKAIENLLLLPEDRQQRMMKDAQERVRLHFNLEKQRKEFLEFYE
ncbi:glycosyltransferase family 4 protein [uncultured Psychroserpens sp.]|uniref:glycosyltransferase family 4 protein n=1 Tax=uncultured Psychroserpens sp. TaxID=255436 RepID=UPI00260F3B55|nr:glycosyltransferase family 4 protein [uncultured Psychroserpens sp.]